MSIAYWSDLARNRVGEKATMANTGRGILGFLIGLGIGVGVGMLFAPQSGEDTREWLSDLADDKIKRVRRQGRRWLSEARDVLDESEDKVTKIFRTSKDALGTVASKLH
jgi:gas vesicle protein